MQVINSAKPDSQVEHLGSSVIAMALHMQCKDNSTCVIHYRQLAEALTGCGFFYLLVFHQQVVTPV